VTIPLFQGVVTYMSPVEAFATGIKNFDHWKSSLIAWLLRSEALDHLILQEFKGQNVATPAKYLRKCVDRLILVAQNSSWSLDRLLKRTLITWFHFDPGRKRFYRRRLCDYPLISTPISTIWALLQSSNSVFIGFLMYAVLAEESMSRLYSNTESTVHTTVLLIQQSW